ncbi:hypothetical protein SHVI106290_19520 [Shewanella violacea]
MWDKVVHIRLSIKELLIIGFKSISYGVIVLVVFMSANYFLLWLEYITVIAIIILIKLITMNVEISG